MYFLKNGFHTGGDTMATLIAACGLDCANCEAYNATQVGDLDALAMVAEKWKVEYASPELTADTIQCDGCMLEGRKIGHCAECNIRQCVTDRGFENCAACPDYGCEKLEGFLKFAPLARANLEALRQ
jgi:hypothetical protein